ncbi:hypothetical protein [Flavobacterium sp. PL002]|uniref:hypothetical protein n=1 Tax=Flavobacterium sp. PL002 TaxID=1897058 RepID=UPI001787F2EE|nr:hypothetical protein [Flavobacterium sp. PL002]MBE0392186.1 hypothetical protein [Flavobacterium sp. PL002]
MKKQLLKPEYWQDFEDLCKNLWGDLWSIPLKIKKNGRSGQVQNGVDVYGIPKGEKDYWGIQCKLKDEYTGAQLNIKDIDIEVQKAKKFKPTLKVFIIATTANKDSKIEEYVRLLNYEQIRKGDFEIELFCWEDIADEILKRKNILDIYLNLIKYKSEHDFRITINECENDALILSPQYHKGIIQDKLKKTKTIYPWSETRNGLNLMFDTGSFGSGIKKTDLSCCLLNVNIFNPGSNVIEDWKLILDFEDGFKYLDIINSGKKKETIHFLKSSVNISKNTVTYGDDKPFIQKDKRSFQLWMTPFENQYEVEISWQLLARDFNLNGIIKIIIEPVYEEKNLTNEVDQPYEIKKERPYTKSIIIYE